MYQFEQKILNKNEFKTNRYLDCILFNSIYMHVKGILHENKTEKPLNYKPKEDNGQKQARMPFQVTTAWMDTKLSLENLSH